MLASDNNYIGLVRTKITVLARKDMEWKDCNP